MKLQSLAVMSLLVLLALGSSFSSAQTFGFLSAAKAAIYCDYEVLNNHSALGPIVWQGSDITLGPLSGPCGATNNGTIVGISTNATITGMPYPSGAGVFYADDIYDAYSGTYTGAQYGVFTKLCNMNNCVPANEYGWIGYAGMSGFIFGDNYGYLIQPPFRKYARALGTIAGKLARAESKK
jgi:hypothetical protein